MATIKYLLQSKNNPAPIYLRMSLGRGKVIKRKSGYVIDPKSWSSSTGYPKPNNDTNKSIKAKLISLEGSIIEAYNKDNAKGELIEGDWLLTTINELQNRVNENNKEYVVEYCQYFIDNLPYDYDEEYIDIDHLYKINHVYYSINTMLVKPYIEILLDGELNFLNSFS